MTDGKDIHLINHVLPFYFMDMKGSERDGHEMCSCHVMSYVYIGSMFSPLQVIQQLAM